jgi:hypothetical protein
MLLIGLAAAFDGGGQPRVRIAADLSVFLNGLAIAWQQAMPAAGAQNSSHQALVAHAALPVRI